MLLAVSAAAIIDEQDSYLNEALQTCKFWRLWAARKSEEKLKGVLGKLNQAFTKALSTALLQVTAPIMRICAESFDGCCVFPPACINLPPPPPPHLPSFLSGIFQTIF